ncbi:hypothetical protein EVAR_17847_1 [Eumeta japonica]|uniref:Uncharacterized protein n=1 Tax=Eumeta variegata TaxID=151549 RepID=A0A4C1TTP3_EUMVA|nr:hypothetical protein EVAR_17847_1 [Eumeta japonica]
MALAIEAAGRSVSWAKEDNGLATRESEWSLPPMNTHIILPEELLLRCYFICGAGIGYTIEERMGHRNSYSLD